MLGLERKKAGLVLNFGLSSKMQDRWTVSTWVPGVPKGTILYQYPLMRLCIPLWYMYRCATVEKNVEK